MKVKLCRQLFCFNYFIKQHFLVLFKGRRDAVNKGIESSFYVQKEKNFCTKSIITMFHYMKTSVQIVVINTVQTRNLFCTKSRYYCTKSRKYVLPVDYTNLSNIMQYGVTKQLYKM